MAGQSSIFRRTAFSGLNIYIEYCIGFLCSIFIARSLSPEQYGSYAYLIWIMSLGTSIINAGITTGVIRFMADARGSGQLNLMGGIDRHLRFIQACKILILAVIILVVISWKPTLLLQTHWTMLLWLLPLVLYLKTLQMYRVSVLKGNESFEYLAMIPLVVSPLNLLLVVALYFIGAPIEYFVSSYFFVTVLYWQVTQYYVRKVSVKWGHDPLDNVLRERINRHLKVAGVSSILSFIVFSQSEIAFLKWLGYADSVGYFSIAYHLSGAAMLLVPGVFSSVLLPMIARSVADGRGLVNIKVQVSTVYLLQLSLLIAVPICFSAPQIIVLFYGQDYTPAIIVLQFAIMFSVIKGLSSPATSYLMSVEKQPLVLRVTAVFVVITLLLDWWLIYAFGLYGAIAANSISSILMVFVLNALTYNHMQAKPLWRMLGLTVLASMIASIPFALLWLFDMPWLTVVAGSAAYIFIYILLLVYLGAIRPVELQQVGKLLKGRVTWLGDTLDEIARRRGIETDSQ